MSAIALVLIATLTLRPAPARSPPHPLDPLTADEIQTVVAVIKAAHPLSEAARFPNISLQEPDKELVWAFQPGDEKWPIMTVHKTGFKVMSYGFFPQNLVLNVAAPEPGLTAKTS